MGGMTDLINRMQHVREPGLFDESVAKESKLQGFKVDSTDSMTNFINAYQQIEEENGLRAPQKDIVTEENRNKTIGALNVVKGLLESDFSKDPTDVAKKVKTIIDSL